MKSKFVLIPALFLFAFALAACTGGFIPVTSGGNEVATAAAQTVSALQTQSQFATLVSELTRVAQSPTPQPPTATLDLTSTPTATPVPPIPTATQVPPTPTATPRPCNWAEFVTDVSIPDGTDFQPGTAFTKTWRLRNAGTCTWNRSYVVTFVSGSSMNARSEVNLPKDVRPGETVDVPVDMRAPDKEGSSEGFWKMRSDTGVAFGLGPAQNESFWVRIDVIKPARTPAMYYDFSANFCEANWRTSTLDELACSGLPGFDPDTENGFVTNFPNPTLENGSHENETAVVTFPSSGRNGYITGNFPAVAIENGDRFRAIIGCLADSIGCDVEFQLNYRLDDNPLQTFGTWQEKYEGGVTRLDVDLSSLRGRQVEFVLTVLNNGNNKADWAFWLRPRIVR